MALTSVLEIVTRTCDELGIARPGTSGLVGASTPQERQLLGLLQAAGDDLVSVHDWSTLITTASITLATASQSYALPTDFDRLIADTGWDRTNNFPLTGGITPQRHQFWLSSSAIAPITRKEFRLFVSNSGGSVYVHPAPTAADNLFFTYITKNWRTDSLATNDANYISADTDLTKFPPKLMVKELKWRFRAAKGLDATALRGECEEVRNQLIARDTGSGLLDMEGPQKVDPGAYLTPDGSWDLI